MASGPCAAPNRSNTWLHRPAMRREDFRCQLGAVHTLHLRDVGGKNAQIMAILARPCHAADIKLSTGRCDKQAPR
jgi:hypothetical protein